MTPRRGMTFTAVMITVLAGSFALALVSGISVRPSAAFTVTNCAPSLIIANATTCTFNGSTSKGDLLEWAWLWGDGRSETHPGPITKYTYRVAGSYCVRLTVKDRTGAASYATKLLTVPRTITKQPSACPSTPKPPVTPPGTRPETVVVYRPGRVDTLRLPGRVDTVRVPARVDTVTVGFKTDTLYRHPPPGSIWTQVPSPLPPCITINNAIEFLVSCNGTVIGRVTRDSPVNFWAYKVASPGSMSMRVIGIYPSAIAAIDAVRGP